MAIVSLAAQVLPAADAHADGFYKFGGIDVDAKDKHQDGWAELSSISTLSLSLEGDTCPAAVSGAGAIVISTVLDENSGELLDAACSGETIPRMEIHLHSSKKAHVPYIRQVLSNVTVTQYATSTTSNRKGDPIPTEEVTLSYEELEWAYVEPSR